MGMAEMAEVLWTGHLKPQPGQPAVARPRPLCAVQRPRLDAAVRAAAPQRLRPAHGRAEELPPAAQQDPGPPRVGVTPGVETTTGPLGQGQPTRWAWRWPRSCWQPSSTARPHMVDHFTYVFLGDGCLMEGISHEACSLAGTLAPVQAGGVLRRQRHQHRRPCGGLVHRRHAGKRFEGLWLERDRPVDGHDRRPWMRAHPPRRSAKPMASPR
jgi:transketolase